MNPLRIPRTVLACVGVVIDTAVRMHCQNRNYEAAVRAAAPKSEQELVEAEAERPPYPAASATAAPSPAIPPASDTDPVGVVDGPPASAAPAGPPSELAELIAAVLDAHEGHYNRASSVFECVEYHADGGLRRVPVGDDYQGWLQHVAPLIAERIETSTRPDAFVIADWVADAARYIGGLPEDAARRVATSVSVRFAEATITP